MGIIRAILQKLRLTDEATEELSVFPKSPKELEVESALSLIEDSAPPYLKVEAG